MRIVRQGALFCQAEIENLTVTALSDGHLDMPVTDLIGADDMSGIALHGGQLRLAVHAFVVQGAAGALLIDTGGGKAWVPTVGRLGQAMGEAGIDPGDIGQIALTHVHTDHFGGLLGPEAAMMFANVTRIFVPVEELGAFRKRCGGSPMVDKVMPLEQGDGPMPGVFAVNAPGHTAGHMAYLVENRLLIWGDIVHVPQVQFADPGVRWSHDDDGEMALQSRLRLMGRAADEGLMVAGAHLDFPAMGRVDRVGAGFGYDALGDEV
jgi:glyoxylase-like metal-dependent hydrolase (beta-lactamase superfamily II)